MRILYLPNAYSQQRQREKPSNIYPVRMAMEAQWYREQGHDVRWEFMPIYDNFDRTITEPEYLPFLSLPHPDRIWSKAKFYTSGNYKYLPGTHMMSASGCWHGKCTFCVEQGQCYECREVADVLQEVQECKGLGFKEIFDDSATFPAGRWLESFCQSAKYMKMTFGCNMRMINADYKMMKEAGFRMVLFGLESVRQDTLDCIKKGVSSEDYKYIIKASQVGLEPHVAVMFGYPWESDQDAINTLQRVHFLLKKGYAKTAQASFFTQRGCSSNESQRKYVRKIYDICKSPEFWFNKIKDIKNASDIKYLWKQIKVGLREWI